MKDFANHKDARIRAAFEIAKKVHAGQVDKGGVEYINHPLTVASNVGENISAIIVALLHDVVEDSAKTFDELQREIPLTADELQALKLLTHDKNIPYLDYVKQIKTNELAAQVKAADLRHNSDLSRLKNPVEKDLKRVEKYRLALEILGRKTFDND
jgi:hypothetical protein